LRVHRRRTATAGGSSRGRDEVYCPRQQSYVGLEECSECKHEVGVDRRPSGLFLLCDFPVEKTSTKHGGLGAEPVSTIMTNEVACVTADLPLDALARLLLEHHISGVPVVDEDGAPVGVVTKTDLLRALSSSADKSWQLRAHDGDIQLELRPAELRSLAGRRVREVMTTLVFALAADASIARAAALMAYEGIHRVPVVSDDGRVVGLLSSLDVLRWLALASGYVVGRPPPLAPRDQPKATL
jgi:CBS domain-containing protein